MDYLENILVSTIWLSGSGGTGKSHFHHRAISSKTRAVRERWNHCLLEPMLSGLFVQASLTMHVHFSR
jgi:hypothetical protein